MRITDLLNKTKPLAIKFVSGDKEAVLNIEYRLHSISFETLKRLEGLSGWESVTEQLLTYLASWDLTDDDGKDIPITREAIEEYRIPLTLVAEILKAIRADIEGDSESKNG